MTTQSIVKKTLEDYQVEHRVLPTSSKSSGRGAVYKHNIFISATNDYDIAYNANQYLFKSDNTNGQRLIRSMYNLISKKAEYIYVLYTNTVTGTNLTRMLQHIWAFPSANEVAKFLPEMLEQLDWAKNSHIISLPLESDLGSHISQSFIDPYYYKDCIDIFRRINGINSTLQIKRVKFVPFVKNMTFTMFNKALKYNRNTFDLQESLLQTSADNINNKMINRLAQLEQQYYVLKQKEITLG